MYKSLLCVHHLFQKLRLSYRPQMQFPKGFIYESKPLSQKKERKITHSHQGEKSNYNQNKLKQLDLHHDA
uniref:Uncharacterized protein n=1 Tax=Daucus carota subsp. sativus TaxID=79200 RepID=A0A175YL29_DAUCS